VDRVPPLLNGTWQQNPPPSEKHGLFLLHKYIIHDETQTNESTEQMNRQRIFVLSRSHSEIRLLLLSQSAAGSVVSPRVGAKPARPASTRLCGCLGLTSAGPPLKGCTKGARSTGTYAGSLCKQSLQELRSADRVYTSAKCGPNSCEEVIQVGSYQTSALV
jgi:hypothetical protein